jgi:hypothetical protein
MDGREINHAILREVLVGAIVQARGALWQWWQCFLC